MTHIIHVVVIDQIIKLFVETKYTSLNVNLIKINGNG